MPWTMAERVRMVELYHQMGSATQARRTFMRDGDRRHGPTARTIMGLVNRFRSTGGVARATRARGPSVSTQAAVPVIRRAVLRTPMVSVRRLARKTGIDRCCVHRILRKWLRLHPYKLQRVHAQKRGDKAKRVRFCARLLPKLRALSFCENLFMSDEALFYLNGNVVKQNCRFWGTGHREPRRHCEPGSLCSSCHRLVCSFCRCSDRAIFL